MGSNSQSDGKGEPRLIDHIGVLSGDTLSVKVPPEVLEAEPDDGENFGRGFEVGVDHSFRSIGGGSNRDTLTVKLEAGVTRLRIGARIVTFDGFRYFPTDFRDDRRPVENADVDFEDNVDEVRDMTVADLVDGLRSGQIEPIPKRDD